jgi:diguanylate cyclase (GGDEF)-like protein
MQRLQEESLRSARTKQPFGLIMLDVDHFKSYNDNFGHQAGDEVLRRVAVVLRDATRVIDCVGRYGGEEFAVILPETGSSGALEVAERIRARVQGEKFEHREVTVSVGVSEYPSDGDSADAIISIADAALYAAKHGGRNRVVKGGTGAPKPVERPSTPKLADQAVLPPPPKRRSTTASAARTSTATKSTGSKPRKKS